MIGRLNMFGPEADRPVTGRIATTPKFSQTIPAEFLPLPSIERPDPVGHLLDVPKQPSVKDSVEAITNMLLSTEASEERNALVLELDELAKRMKAFLETANAKRRAELRKQVTELTAQCRASLERLNALRLERGELESRVHALEERIGTANRRLRVAMRSKPDDDTFPTEAELAQWNANVEKARAAVERESEPQAALQERIDRNDAERRAVGKQLTELKQRRENCRAELEGRPRKGPFGLRVPSA